MNIAIFNGRFPAIPSTGMAPQTPPYPWHPILSRCSLVRLFTLSIVEGRGLHLSRATRKSHRLQTCATALFHLPRISVLGFTRLSR